MKNKNKPLSSKVNQHIGANQPNIDADANREAVLLGELQIAQLELEMQNDELSMAVSLLDSQRAKFEGFFNLAPTGYFIIDSLGVVQEVNNIGAKMLSVERLMLVGQRLQSFILPEDYEIFYNFLKQLEPGGQQRSTIVRFASKGQIIYTRTEGIGLKDNFSGKFQFYVTVSDITESRLAELELKDTAQRLELTLSASGIGTWNIDADTGLLRLDKYSLSLLGIKPWEFDNNVRSFFNFVHPEDQPLVRRLFRKILSGTPELETEFRISQREGAVKNILLKGIMVSMEGAGAHMAGIMVDVTRDKQIELAKRELDAEKQRIVYQTTFSAQEKERERISSALHDSVCQLLYGIRLNLHNLPNVMDEVPGLTNAQILISQAIKELRNLSYELTPAILTDFGLIAAIREMVDRLQNASFRIVTQFKPEVDTLNSDLRLSLFRICQELLNNIIKHSQASKAQIIIRKEQDKICLTVSDNGVGFKTEPTTVKTGSGLRAIKNRVFLLNGTVDIETSTEGTTVKITINNK